MQPNEPYVPPFLRQRLPRATEQELVEAARNLHHFVKAAYDLAVEIEQRRCISDSHSPTATDRIFLGAFSQRQP